MVAPVILYPFFFHWYAGEVPPLTGVAVKVTVVPAHTGLTEGLIETPAVSNAFTVMIEVLEGAGFPEAHEMFDVSEQVTASALEGV